MSVVTTVQPHAIGAPAGRGLPSEEDVCGTFVQLLWSSRRDSPVWDANVLIPNGNRAGARMVPQSVGHSSGT